MGVGGDEWGSVGMNGGRWGWEHGLVKPNHKGRWHTRVNSYEAEVTLNNNNNNNDGKNNSNNKYEIKVG